MAKVIFKSLGVFFLGLLACLSFLLAFVVLLPVLVYRWIVCNIIAPRYHPEIGKPVTLNGQAFATEFLRRKRHLPPRSTIILGYTLDTFLGKEELMKLVEKRWITAKREGGKVDELMYPELQQYIDQWMGFMFWKQDKNFLLENHIVEHEVGQCATPMESKKFVDQLIEELLNKKYFPKKSPWELHLVHNYKDPELRKDGMTVVFFRSHHAMADGYSIFSLTQEALMETPLSSRNPLTKTKSNRRKMTLDYFSNYIYLSFRMMSDVGYAVSLLLRKVTPWHCPDKIKQGKQLYSRSPMIPLTKVKYIKDKLECTFTGVLMSCVSAGATDSFKKKGDKNRIKTVPTAIPIPLPGHPKELTNYLTGTIVELPTEYLTDSLERLYKVEAIMNEAKNSTFPFLMPIAQKLASFSFAPMVRALVTNRVLSTSFSSIPGPYSLVALEGRTLQTANFCSGAYLGCAGMALSALSYVDHVCISAVVEAGLMDHVDLEHFFQRISQEVDTLYEIALKQK